jgi:hypothetical protein
MFDAHGVFPAWTSQDLALACKFAHGQIAGVSLLADCEASMDLASLAKALSSELCLVQAS